MKDNEKKEIYTGRANTALIFGHGDDAQAVISAIVVRICGKKHAERIRFTGPVTFEEKTAKHIVEVVLPVVDNILRTIGLPAKSFEIFVVNLEAAAIMDVGSIISGFSIDFSMLLAILSASLQITIPDDIVSSGHIASIDGDIRMVKGLPEKLAAATIAGSIKTFIHPEIDQDHSLHSLSPTEKQRIAGAIAKAKQTLQTVAVRDINDLLQAVFSNEQKILASLIQGFYKISISPFAKKTPCIKAAIFLAENNEKLLWAVLEQHLFAGLNKEAKELLLALSRFYIHQETYPKDLGFGLFRLVCSLPPQTRRLKLDFPLIPMSECIQLSQFVKEPDHDDVRLLLSAAFGENIHRSLKTEDWENPNKRETSNQDNGRFKAILSEIDSDALTEQIGIPIDSARASYILDSVKVKSFDEFNETIVSFYIHLMRYTRKVSQKIDSDAAGAEALALLERTFNGKGGYSAALAEAKNATNGGLKFILDLVTEQFKNEEQEKHISRVLKIIVDPMDWEKKIALMKEFIMRIEPHLPDEITTLPPERFVGHYEELVKAYVQSMDKVKTLFRSL